MSKITYGDKSAINVNASIPEANKITDANMNDIKGAINQIGSFIPLTAGANADYYYTFKGTLATGDIFSGYFPLVTNGSSNAKLSVNGSGGTYINLIYFDGTQVLGNEVSLKYKSMYYDGTNFVLLDESYSRTNANGTYMKFADGRMTCTKEVSVTTAVNNKDGGFYRSSTQTLGDFAIAFYATPTVFFDLKSVDGDNGVFVFSAFYGTYPPSTTSWGRRVIMSATSLVSNGYVISCLATGRWKA